MALNDKVDLTGSQLAGRHFGPGPDLRGIGLGGPTTAPQDGNQGTQPGNPTGSDDVGTSDEKVSGVRMAPGPSGGWFGPVATDAAEQSDDNGSQTDDSDASSGDTDDSDNSPEESGESEGSSEEASNETYDTDDTDDNSSTETGEGEGVSGENSEETDGLGEDDDDFEGTVNGESADIGSTIDSDTDSSGYDDEGLGEYVGTDANGTQYYVEQYDGETIVSTVSQDGEVDSAYSDDDAFNASVAGGDSTVEIVVGNSGYVVAVDGNGDVSVRDSGDQSTVDITSASEPNSPPNQAPTIDDDFTGADGNEYQFYSDGSVDVTINSSDGNSFTYEFGPGEFTTVEMTLFGLNPYPPDSTAGSGSDASDSGQQKK